MDRGHRVVSLAAATTLSLAVAVSAFAASKGATITGFGATVSAWNKHHRADHRGNLIPGCCYDPIAPHDGLTYADRYFSVQPIGGREIGYEIWTGNNTSAAAAKQIALRELPSDATVRSFTVHGTSCAILILTSRQLSAKLHGKGGGVVIVEFSSGPGSSSYNARSVNDLLFSSGLIGGSTAQSC